MKVRCLYDELAPIDGLTPHPKNRNKHPDDQIKRLAEILKYQGWRYPIKVSKQTGFITSGHGRLLAARLNGWDKVPINKQDYETEDQEYADVQADNAIASWAELDLAGINLDLADLGPDFDLDLLGIKDFVLEPADKFHADEDEVPEPPKEPISKLGDLYEIGNHRVLCGDSTKREDVDRLMDGQKAELCFTSPPYADQRQYNDKSLDLNIDHIASFITASAHQVKLYAVVLGLMRREGSIEPYWDAFIQAAKNNNLPFISWNVWDKGYSGSIGNASAMFTIDHEWVFVFGQKKELNRTVPNKYAGDVADHSWTRQQDGSITKAKTRTINSHRQLGTVLRCNPEKQSTLYKHPAMYPVELPEKYLEAATDAHDVLYEPFTGSGSTLIACEKTNRKCFGMEIDPLYIDVIVSRWCKFTGKTKIKKNGEDVEWAVH
mgnify:CR=1 FL=1